MTITGIRGTFFDFVDDPWKHVGDEEASARFLSDGLLVIEDGIIIAFGEYSEIVNDFADIDVTHIEHRIITPGFIDGHIHFPQTRVLGAFGDKYGETVKVYTAGDPDGEWYSMEICGGPHVEHTGTLGEGGKHFKITKEESSSAGIRRIKAVLR